MDNREEHLAFPGKGKMDKNVRLHSHSYECESGYPCAGYSKHDLACIPIAAITLKDLTFETNMSPDTQDTPRIGAHTNISITEGKSH